MTSLTPLSKLAQTIRSKNAGPDCITFDIIFGDDRIYELVKNNDALTPQRIASLYGIKKEWIIYFGTFDPARAIKFTMKRLRPSGSPGESDVMGSQMYAPLLDVKVAVSAETLARIVA